ncbi:chlorophyll synthesis pathway protein BchC [Cryptococcus neoformans Bt1]|nr:chlorophyll synthesis pathway protein BchC [Cryptococcus neoformans var. grubii Bt1]
MIAGRRATPDWLGAQGSFLYPRRLPMPDGFIPHDVIREPTRCLCSLPTSVYTSATTKADILFPFFLFSSLSIKHINLNLINPLSQPHLQLKQQLNTMVAKEMNALLYSEPRKFEITKVPVPEIGPEEVLLKVDICGVCGTDQHIHEGEFIAKFPLVPGHEAVGRIVAMGDKVKGFDVGDRIAADVGETCGYCHYCRKGTELFCENFAPAGVARDGGFADYIKYHFAKCYKIKNLSDEEATLLEPASCAIHGMDVLKMPFGARVLLIGAGPTGLILAQLMKMGGASHITIAANAGIKMDIARKVEAADEYIDLDRSNPGPQWAKLKEDNPYGFDVVAEATGVESLVNDAINYVTRGGTLLVYGVYEDKARLPGWSPTDIFVNEKRIIGSFSQTYCFPRAIDLLDSGKIKTTGMVTDVFPLSDYQGALDKMASRKALKIAIKPEHKD